MIKYFALIGALYTKLLLVHVIQRWVHMIQNKDSQRYDLS